ncbi:hypothetical protein ACFFHM_10545 [Halalkalibacter kiskunsagensis]|uniref:Major facilitator superfamily (MFS) profile domain-containing protein n=1 Tax=Halalkalibacter kiskunsagensis TaxID=1548599 RepID=A0ABV6KC84_9BACI
MQAAISSQCLRRNQERLQVFITFRYMGGMMASAMVSLLAGTFHLLYTTACFLDLGLVVSVGFTVRSRVGKETNELKGE